MSRINLCALIALGLAALAPTRANAFACLKDHKAFQLSGDSIEYSMAIAPGAECIQGLRWSFMQVFAVWVLKKPVNGELVMVGPGFRYAAKPNSSGTDKFSLLVVGKNGLQEEGYSTVVVTVSQPAAPAEASPIHPAPSQPKVAEAALAQ